MFRFARLLRENHSKLAAKITEEQGKTIADAEGDVLRGIRKLFCNIKNVFFFVMIFQIEKKKMKSNY